MDSSSQCQILLEKISKYHRLSLTDPDEKLKSAIQDLFHLWPEMLNAATTATEDELFALNISRATFTQVFAIVLSKDFINKDHELVRKIFFILFNILVNHTDIYRNNNSIFMDSNIRLIIKMASSIISLVRFKDGDFSKPDDQQLFIAIREHIDQYSKDDNLTDAVISFIWNLADQTLLVPILINAGYGNSVVQWIKTREENFRDDKIDAPIYILHNLSRHDDGITELNNCKALEVIDDVKFESNIDENVNHLTIHITMIRALLTDIDQIKADATNYPMKIVDTLLKLSMNAATGDRYRHNGSHVSESLTVLVKLFYNDDILQSILSKKETVQSIIELFTSLLLKLYPKINVDNERLENYTCVVILNLFWLISNHEQYRQIFRKHEQLMSLIANAANDEQTFTDRFMPRTLKSIQQAAKDILSNLNNEN